LANSLQDQLRKSGLVSSQKAKQANAQKRKTNKQVRGGVEDEAASRRATLAQEAAAQVERDRALNKEKQQAADERAIAAQIVQLVAMNTVDRGDESVSFNYTEDGKIRSVHVSETLRDALVRGQLALVRGESGTAIVPAGVARKVALRDASCVILLNEITSAETPLESDDPYGEFEVPDDLMW
jgi:uncharacterized protein